MSPRDAPPARAPDSPGDSDALDAELREEFDHHLDLLAASERESGLSEPGAAERALRRFGDPARYARRCRHIVLGEPLMKTKLLIGWNIVLTVAVCFASLVAYRAYTRSVGPLVGSGSVRATLSDSDRKAILRSIWGDTAGIVEVKGAVASPGRFQTSLDSPLSVAQLVEMAGGANPDAKMVAMARPDIGGEAYVSLKNAFKNREETQLMPEPGSVIDVR